MNLKQLIRFAVCSGETRELLIHKTYYSAFCEPGGSKSFVRLVQSSSTTSAYAAGYTIKQGNSLPLANSTGDGVDKYPIQLKGAKKVYFDIPDDMKATVFFVSSESASAAGRTIADWVDGDNSAYDANVQNGPREVTVPEGADGFAFSLYWKNKQITSNVIGASVHIYSIT